MNSKWQLEFRDKAHIITLAEVIHEFPEPENLRLQLSPNVRKKPIDVGSWAYFIRAKNPKIHDGRGSPVVTESFVESRRDLIAKILPSYFGMRDATILTRTHNAEVFIDWLNLNGYRDIFTSDLDAQNAYRDYTAHLNHQVALGKLKRQSAHSFQAEVIRMIQLLYPESSHYILAGAVKITEERGSAAASPAHVDLYLDVCLAITKHCGDFVLKKKPYPCVVKIRDYEVVVFPSKMGAVGPFRRSPFSYNAGERRIATVEEFCAAQNELGLKSCKPAEVAANLRQTLASFQAANDDPRHWHRYGLASLALKAYAMLLMMITGATPTEFQQFKYKDAVEVVKSPLKKELSAVKFRAAGKGTLYNIGRETGLPLLKQYLKLREWILNGKENELLFFHLPSKAKRKTPDYCISEAVFDFVDAMNHFHRSVSGIFLEPSVPTLSSRKMRKHKSNGMHTAGMAPETVAAALNHTQAMNLLSYTEAAPEQLEREFSQFWESIRHAADYVRKRSQTPTKSEITTAAGHCAGFNNPLPARFLQKAVVEPNCLTQYGCLYCEHYVCHSDEEDLHKLLSLQYVINAVRRVAPDSAHAEALYKDLSVRIEFILDALSGRSLKVKKIVETVGIRVFEYGELTPFWEARLSRYEKMGIVF